MSPIPNTAGQVRWLRIDPSSDGYPWGFPCLSTIGFPTPGMFVNLNEEGHFSPEEGFDALVRATLFSALVMADADTDLANSRTSQARRLRQEVRKTVWNDWNMGLYASDNANFCCGVDPDKPGGAGRTCVVDHVMDREGRGICWLPTHANNFELLSRGLAPRRTIMHSGDLFPGTVGTHWPLLWLPALVLEALARPLPEVEVETWPDGSSCLSPPKEVAQRGLQDPVALPGMPTLVDAR